MMNNTDLIKKNRGVSMCSRIVGSSYFLKKTLVILLKVKSGKSLVRVRVEKKYT